MSVLGPSEVSTSLELRSAIITIYVREVLEGEHVSTWAIGKDIWWFHRRNAR
jgi:hypothetical protein